MPCGILPVATTHVRRGRRNDLNIPETSRCDQALLRSQFPNENPIGRRVRFEANTPWRAIVSVAADVKMGGLGGSAEPGIFVPYRQSGFVGGELAGLVLRTSLGLVPLAAEIRKQVAQVDPQQPSVLRLLASGLTMR